jgi:hypothetical protein
LHPLVWETVLQSSEIIILCIGVSSIQTKSTRNNLPCLHMSETVFLATHIQPEATSTRAPFSIRGAHRAYSTPSGRGYTLGSKLYTVEPTTQATAKPRLLGPESRTWEGNVGTSVARVKLKYM